MEEYSVRRTKNESSSEGLIKPQNGGLGSVNSLYSQKVAAKKATKNNPPIDSSGIDTNVTELYPDQKNNKDKESRAPLATANNAQNKSSGNGLSNLLLFLLLLSNLGLIGTQAHLFNKVGEKYQETNNGISNIQKSLDSTLPSIDKTLGEIKGELSNNFDLASKKIASLSREIRGLKFQRSFKKSNGGGNQITKSSNNISPVKSVLRDDYLNKTKDGLSNLASPYKKTYKENPGNLANLPVNESGVFMDDKSVSDKQSNLNQVLSDSQDASHKKFASNRKHYPVRCWKKRRLFKRCFLSHF